MSVPTVTLYNVTSSITVDLHVTKSYGSLHVVPPPIHALYDQRRPMSGKYVNTMLHLTAAIFCNPGRTKGGKNGTIKKKPLCIVVATLCNCLHIYLHCCLPKAIQE